MHGNAINSEKLGNKKSTEYLLKNEVLKMEVRQLKDKISDTQRVVTNIETIAGMIINDYLASGEGHRTSRTGYWKEQLEINYINDVKKIINLLDNTNIYKSKLQFWIDKVTLYNGNYPDNEEPDAMLAQVVLFLKIEATGRSFIAPASTKYPDYSLLTIITNLYSSLS